MVFHLLVFRPGRMSFMSCTFTFARHSPHSTYTSHHILAQAEAFAYSGRNKQVASYARAVAQAIQTGGQSATKAYAAAFSQAFSGAAAVCALKHVHVPGVACSTIAVLPG